MQSHPAVRKRAAYPEDVSIVLKKYQIELSDHGHLDLWLLGYLWCMSGVPAPTWLRRTPNPKPFPGVTFKDAAVVADFFNRLEIAGNRLTVIQQAQELEYPLHYNLSLASGNFEILSDDSFCFLDGFEAAEVDIRRNDKIQAKAHLGELLAYLDQSHLCLRCNHRVYAEPIGRGECPNCGL